MYKEAHIYRLKKQSEKYHAVYLEKLERLDDKYKDHDAQSSFEKRRDLKKAIKELEEELAELEKTLEEIDEKIKQAEQKKRDPLYEALLELNYTQQEEVFSDFKAHKYKFGAFVIYGERGYGQSWLMNRLIKAAGFDSNAFKRHVNLQILSHPGGTDIFKELLGCPDVTSLQDLAKALHDKWHTQCVILAMHNFGGMNAGPQKDFIDNFWQELVKIASSQPSISAYYHLLLLFIDENNSGGIDSWPVTFVDEIDSSWEPHMFLRAPRLTPFTREVLTDWIKQVGHKLPCAITVDDILQDQPDGKPERVLQTICTLCGDDWFEREHEWIHY